MSNNQMVYQWKPASAHRFKVPAAVAGNEFEKIRRARGKLTAPIIVEAAEDVKNPLHRAFEWNDTKAAKKWREEVASEMLRSITVVIEDDSEKEITTRALVAVSSDEGGHRSNYIPVALAMSKPETRKEVMGRALDELNAWRRRYAELKELEALFVRIDETLERQQKKSKKSRRKKAA